MSRRAAILGGLVCFSVGCADAGTPSPPTDTARESGMDAVSEVWELEFPGADAPEPIRLDRVPVIGRGDVPFDVPRCMSGTTARCVCRGGVEGLQVCNDGGTYETCQCSAAPPPSGTLPPRLLRPFSGLRSMTQRPTFRWVLPTGVTRARIEVCGDRPCTRHIAQVEVTGSSWRPTDTLPPGVAFWRVSGLRDDGASVWTSATWEVGIRHRDTPVDSAWGPLKDFNGDGLDDVVMLAYPPDLGSDERDARIFVSAGDMSGHLAAPIVLCRTYAVAKTLETQCLRAGMNESAQIGLFSWA